MPALLAHVEARFQRGNALHFQTLLWIEPKCHLWLSRLRAYFSGVSLCRSRLREVRTAMQGVGLGQRVPWASTLPNFGGSILKGALRVTLHTAAFQQINPDYLRSEELNEVRDWESGNWQISLENWLLSPQMLDRRESPSPRPGLTSYG